MGAVPHLLRENGRLGRPPEISEGLRLFEPGERVQRRVVSLLRRSCGELEVAPRLG